MSIITFKCGCGGMATQSPATKSIQLKKWGEQRCKICTKASSRAKHSARLIALYNATGRNNDEIEVECPVCLKLRKVQRRQAKGSLICIGCAASKAHEAYSDSYKKASDHRIDNKEFSKSVSDGLIDAFTSDERTRRAIIASSYWKDEQKRNAILQYRLTNEYRLAISNGLLKPEVRLKLAANARIHWKLMWEKPEFRAKMAIIRAKQLSHISSIHLIVNDYLRILKIEYQNEYPIGPWVFDCFIQSHNILIEIQGDYWHSLPRSMSNDQAKATYINRYMPGTKIIYFYEHEFYQFNSVLDRLKSELKIDQSVQLDFDIKKVEIRKVSSDEIRNFMFKYHYIGPNNHSTHFGFYLGNELVAACSISGVTRYQTATRLGLSTKEIRELSRFCIHPTRHKKNLASRCLGLLSRWLRLHTQYTYLISFADPGVGHTGTIYKASNWVYDGITEPSHFYRSYDGFVMHKKTLYNRATNLGLNEADFAAKYRYDKIRCPGKHRFIFKLR